MASIADVTSLITSSQVGRSIKRKRSVKEEIVGLKPILKGGLCSSKGKVIWNGWWGLTKSSYTEVFTEEVIKAPFHFERTATASDSSSTEITEDGYFSGYFCMQDLTKKQSPPTYIKHFENRILLRFVKSKDASNTFEVVGSGENKFGKFLIEGRFNSESHEIDCSRNYLPSPKALKRKSMRFESPPVTPKRSLRNRCPTLKLKESLDAKPLTTTFNFDGREELLELIISLENEELREIVEALSNRRFRCFKLAKNQILKLVKNEKIVNKIEEMYLKYKKVVEVDLSDDEEDTSPERGDDEELNYVSIFQLGDEEGLVDPLLFDPAAELPDSIRSPVLFDFRECFKRTLEEDCNSNLSEELRDLCPLNAVDYSDLSYLDADTLKELNEFVEFSCPSKGA